MNENVKFMQHTTGATGAPLYYWCDWSSSILLVRLELLYTTGATGALQHTTGATGALQHTTGATGAPLY